jgi:methyl-accepting chemotaxis protein
VAGEVRNLAQSSAEAAKEIKSLITASVEHVEQDTHLVDQAGADSMIRAPSHPASVSAGELL